SSPTRKRCPSNQPIDFRPHKAVAPVRSTGGQIRHKCANRGSDWRPLTSNAGPIHENPYDKASPVGPTGTPQCRAGFPGKSAGRTPIHQLRENRLSGVHGRGPPRKRGPETAANFKSTPPKKRQKLL